jgi:hypothetical protein
MPKWRMFSGAFPYELEQVIMKSTIFETLPHKALGGAYWPKS